MIEYLLIFIVASLGFYLYLQSRRKLNFFKDRGIPYHNGYPIFGNMTKVFLKLETLGEFLLRICEDFKTEPVFGAFTMVGTTYMVQDFEMIKQIMTTHADNFINRSGMISSDHKADILFTKSLLGLRNEKWKKMRATVSPTFTSSKMRLLFDLIRDSADDFISYLKENLRSDGTIEIATRDVLARATMNAISTTALGLKIDSLREKDHIVYSSAMKLVLNSLNLRNLLVLTVPKLANFLDISLFDQSASAFFKELINESIQEREEKNIYRPDVIQLLLAEKSNMTNDELLAQVFIFFLGGFEGVSQNLQHSLYELAVNQDCQEKLFKEVERTKKNLAGKPISYDDLNELEYMDAFINEVLRKKFVGMIDRKCASDITLVDSDGKEHKFEGGTCIMIPNYSINHDQRIFPNPERFDPDRFLGDKKKRYGVAFTPFGIGPRNCIGMRFALMEWKLVLYSIVSEFISQPCVKTMIPFRWGLGFTFLPLKPIILELKKR